MVTIDAHQHFWDPDAASYIWMTDEVSTLRRRFSPDHLKPLMHRFGVDYSITVQARSELSETSELLALASENPAIAGVVGWVDLADAGLGETLDELISGPTGERFLGARHQVEEEPLGWLSRTQVIRGLRALGARDLVYDLLVRPDQLVEATAVVDQLPEVRFVIDHGAKPPMSAGVTEPWGSGMTELARRPNVSCKLSGLSNSAGPDWTVNTLRPFVEHIIKAFGSDRLMFGSDWPVCTLTADYGDVVAATSMLIAELSPAERHSILGAHAIAVYRLKLPSALADPLPEPR